MPQRAETTPQPKILTIVSKLMEAIKLPQLAPTREDLETIQETDPEIDQEKDLETDPGIETEEDVPDQESKAQQFYPTLPNYLHNFNPDQLTIKLQNSNTNSSRRRNRDRRDGDRRRRDRSASEEVKNDGTTVYIKGLDRKIQKSDLEGLFNEFGEINDVDIVKDPFTE